MVLMIRQPRAGFGREKAISWASTLQTAILVVCPVAAFFLELPWKACSQLPQP